MTFIIRGIDPNGNVGWYTGKAGEGWVSADKADAFVYRGWEAASRKATLHNRFTALHGWHFMAADKKDGLVGAPERR